MELYCMNIKTMTILFLCSIASANAMFWRKEHAEGPNPKELHAKSKSPLQGVAPGVMQRLTACEEALKKLPIGHQESVRLQQEKNNVITKRVDDLAVSMMKLTQALGLGWQHGNVVSERQNVSCNLVVMQEQHVRAFESIRGEIEACRGEIAAVRIAQESRPLPVQERAVGVQHVPPVRPQALPVVVQHSDESLGGRSLTLDLAIAVGLTAASLHVLKSHGIERPWNGAARLVCSPLGAAGICSAVCVYAAHEVPATAPHREVFPPRKKLGLAFMSTAAVGGLWLVGKGVAESDPKRVVAGAVSAWSLFMVGEALYKK